MMTALIKDKPIDPIAFLANRLKKPEKKRIVIVTPPGMKGGVDVLNEEQDNVGLMLEQHFERTGVDQMQTICVGDILNKEITMHSKYGDVIQKCRKNYGYIPDEIVIDLVQQHIDEAEK
jgi:adenylate kinase